jgi:hypothetical protein
MSVCDQFANTRGIRHWKNCNEFILLHDLFVAVLKAEKLGIAAQKRREAEPEQQQQSLDDDW